MLRLALIGSSVQKSLSPLIFGWLGEKSNTKVQYDLVDVVSETQLDQVFHQLKAENYDGLNITRPYKAAVLRFSKTANHPVGAVNWVNLKGDSFENTDTVAIEELLKANPPHSAVIYGCGGAARAAVAALKNLNCQSIFVANRTSVTEFCIETGTREFDGNPFEWLIQASPEIRLTQKLEELLSKTKIGVFDMVYLPLKTELIIAADSKRLKTIKGLSMLISQAVVGWEKWTGMNIPKAWYLELENFVEAKCLDS